MLRRAQAEGLTHCPGFDHGTVHHHCGRELDYVTPGRPESAETDHVVQPRFTDGIPDDSVENLRVICRQCNTARESTKAKPAIAPLVDFPTSRAW
ncbi:MAG: HNH endonuclease [Cellulomonadaceae bacterium]|nr:HNH endonuclease [Cellulomonadaceae bacterium]